METSKAVFYWKEGVQTNPHKPRSTSLAISNRTGRGPEFQGMGVVIAHQMGAPLVEASTTLEYCTINPHIHQHLQALYEALQKFR